MRVQRIAAAILLFTSVGWASEESGIEIRGFGSSGLVKSSSQYFLYDYGVDGDKPDFTNLTRVGVNFHAQLNPNWDVAVQFEARGDRQNFNAYLDYGLISWRPNPYFTFKAGRLRVPLWLYSQQIDVGLSYAWVMLPVETYSLTSIIKSGNGASMQGRAKVGPGYLQAEIMKWEAQSSAEVGSDSMPQTSRFSAKNAVVVELSYNIEQRWLFRAVRAQADTSAQVDSRVTVQQPSMPDTVQIFPTSLDVGLGQFSAVGIKYDSELIFGSAEGVRRNIAGSSLTKASAWNAMLGANLGKFSVYGSYSKLYDMEGSGYQHPDYPNVVASQAGAHSYTFGLNYHVNDSAIVKAQFNKAYLSYTDPSVDFNFNMYLASVDFVF